MAIYHPPTLFSFLNQIPQHPFQVTCGMGHDPEVVGPHETANLMCSLCLHGHLLPQPGSFDACPSNVDISRTFFLPHPSVWSHRTPP